MGWKVVAGRGDDSRDGDLEEDPKPRGLLH